MGLARSGRKFEAGDPLRRALNDIAPVNSRPSTSGSATFMARSAGERPRAEAAHCVSRREADADLQNRRVAGVERRRPVVEPRRERGGVEDHVGRRASQSRAQGLDDGGVLEARNIDKASTAKPRRAARRPAPRRRGVAGEPGRAVERDERARPRRAASGFQEFPKRRLRGRLGDIEGAADFAQHQAQRLAGIGGAAVVEIGGKPAQGRRAPASRRRRGGRRRAVAGQRSRGPRRFAGRGAKSRRRRNGNSRGRPAAGSPRSGRAQSPSRHRGRRNRDGADWRGSRAAARRPQAPPHAANSPRLWRAPRDRCRRMTARQCRRASARDRRPAPSRRAI